MGNGCATSLLANVTSGGRTTASDAAVGTSQLATAPSTTKGAQREGSSWRASSDSCATVALTVTSRLSSALVVMTPRLMKSVEPVLQQVSAMSCRAVVGSTIEGVRISSALRCNRRTAHVARALEAVALQ